MRGVVGLRLKEGRGRRHGCHWRLLVQGLVVRLVVRGRKRGLLLVVGVLVLVLVLVVRVGESVGRWVLVRGRGCGRRCGCGHGWERQ